MTLPKFFKKKRFWIIAAIVLAIIVFAGYKLSSQKPQFEYTVEAVKRGSLQQTVSATGGIESAHEISLNFKAAGKIANVSVKEGDIVKQGQELARLDTASMSAVLKQYQASLDSAKANLAKVRAGASSEDIGLTQEQLNKSISDYNNLVRDAQAQKMIFLEKAIDSLNSSVFTSQTALNTIGTGLVDRELAGNLLFSNSGLQNKVSNDYKLLKAQLETVRRQIDEAGNNKSDMQKAIDASDVSRNYLSQLNSFLDDSYRLADSIVVSVSFPQTSKDAIKASIGAQQTAINASLSSVQTAKSNLINGVNSYDSQILAASNSVSIARAQLSLKESGPREFDLSAAQASVNQAQAQLAKLYADLEDYYIKAPIDGKITKVNFLAGETPSGATPPIQMLGTERFEIKADIPESDITKIKIGDKVTIELDAFGSDRPFKGAVTSIDPAQTVIKDVTYYKTTVSFDEDSWNDQIKPGMTASITVKSEQKDNILYIPQRAVRVKEAALGEVPQKFVEVMENDQPQERIVTIGMRGDDGLVEVVSGLNEGDSIVTFKKENK